MEYFKKERYRCFSKIKSIVTNPWNKIHLKYFVLGRTNFIDVMKLQKERKPSLEPKKLQRTLQIDKKRMYAINFERRRQLTPRRVTKVRESKKQLNDFFKDSIVPSQLKGHKKG